MFRSMRTCPIKTSPEWVALQNAYGEDNTWKLYLHNNEEYVSVEQGGFQLFAMNNPVKAGEILDKYLPDSARLLMTPSTTLSELLAQVDPEMYNDKDYINKTGIIKPGVSELFESNPELASIGTQEQYSQYLDTIFPDSKVKDIVYHGGKTNKDSFKRFVDKTKYKDRNPNSILGFFFSSSKNTVAGQYAEKDYDAIKEQLTGDAETDAFIRRSAPLKKGSVSEELLNIKNPYIIQAEEWENETWVDKLNILTEKDKDNDWVSDYKWTVDAYEKVKNHLQSLEYDGLYINSNKELFNKTGIVDYITVQKVVFEPEQIHILGNKQDIQGFKEFAKNEPLSEFKTEEIIQEGTILDQMIESFKDHVKTINHGRANEIVMKLAEKLSAQMGVPYSAIGEEQAYEMLANTKAPYKGQSAFFFNGTVYFVGDKVELEDVLHEFAHPLVKAIQIGNAELFANQYAKLEGTEEGKELIGKVKDLYPELEEDTYRFQEEVMVHALERAAMGNIVSQGFAAFIKELLYQIKQLLRRAVGKVKVENLDSSTTLEELADMLINNNFQIDIEKVTDNDIAMFRNKQLDLAEELMDKADKTLADKGIQIIIDTMYKAGQDVKRNLKTDAYKDIKGELVVEGGGGLIDNLIASITDRRSINLSAERSQAHDKISTNDKAISLMMSLGSLKAVTATINESLQKLDQNDQTNDMLTKLEYYKHLLENWKDVIDSALDNIKEIMPDTQNNVYSFVNSIKLDINKALVGDDNPATVSVTSLRNKGAVQATMTMIKPIQESIFAQYQKKLDDYQVMLDKATSPGVIEGIKAEMEKIRRDINTDPKKFNGEMGKYYISEDKIVKMFAGELKDANFWSTMFEAYTSNPDPIIGTFSVFLQNNQAKIVNNYLAKSEIFNNDTRELMKKLGITGDNIISKNQKDTWGKYLMTNKVSKRNPETGNYEEQEVLSLLSSTYNWEQDVKDHKDKIEAALELARQTLDPDERIVNYNILKTLQAEFDQFKMTFFNQEYTSEFYNDDNTLNNEPYGAQALEARDEVLTRIRTLQNTLPTENERYDNHKELKALWDEYKALSSLYNLDGDLKDEEGQGIAKALTDHSKRMRKYYEWKNIDGAFQRSIENFEITQRALHPNKSDEEIDEIVEDWIIKNTDVRYTNQYYESIAAVYERLDKFNQSLPNTIREKLNVSDLLVKTRNIKNKYRDDFGNPNGNVITDKDRAELLRLQKEISAIEMNYSKKTGLSVEEFEEIVRINRIPLNNRTTEDTIKFNDLQAKRASQGFTTAQTNALNKIMLDLAMLQETEFTDAYQNKINYTLAHNDKTQLDSDRIFTFLYPNRDDNNVIPADRLMEGDKKFKAWFMQNHVKVKYNDRTTGEIKERYKPIAVWSQTRPIKEGDIEKTTYIRNGKNITINRVPGIGFQYRTVKDEFRTIPAGLTEKEREKYVGTIIDNRGNYLPKNREQGAPIDSKYVNNDYYYMKSTQPDQFKLLEKLTELHLSNQIGVQRSDKLYMEYPRFEMKDTEEKLQAGTYFDNLKRKAGSIYAGGKAFFSGEGIEAANLASELPEDIDEGNINARNELDAQQVGAMGMKMATSLSHIQGKANIEMKYISYNMMHALDTYGLSCEKQRVMRQINPVVQAIVDTVADEKNAIKDLNKSQTKVSAMRTITKFFKDPKSANVRSQGLQYLYNREMKGQVYSGNHLDVLEKTTSMIMGAASFSFFALNVPSALRNYYGALWQLNIEAAGGKYIDGSSLLKAKIKSKQDMNDWMLSIYGGAPKSLSHQMILYFDPLQDKSETTIGREYARTASKDFASMSWLYSPRKFSEMEASLQLFNAIMIKQQVVQTINGVETMISYNDAFEVDPVTNQMKLKEGIDKEWDINGAKYFQIRNIIHETSNELNGNFSKFGAPQAQGFFAYRLVSFMRRYFTAMFMKRFAVERVNYSKGQVQTGYYIESMKMIGKLYRSAGKSMMYMTSEEKAVVYKMLSEFAQIAISSLIISAFFGFDPDDKDRYKKLNNKSGALGSDNFHLGGYISNHSLSMFMKVQNENVSLIPLPGYGLKDYMNLSEMGSIAFGPTITSYGTIFTDIAKHAAPGENEHLFYQRDTGPYVWQKEGSAKIWNHIFRMSGITGSDVDPVKGIKGIEFSRR